MIRPPNNNFQAEMKKGKDETEDKVYSWVGRQMKIKITDNRILVGNGSTPISSKMYDLVLENRSQTLIENFYAQIRIKI